MEYIVKTVQKIGVKGYEDALNNVIKDMTGKGWKIQQMLGSPDQGFVILFVKE